MAKVYTTVNAAVSSDATFRVWGAGVKAALTASGLTQTSDTGQIDWTTVAKPAAANTVVGYEVWRFNDALQSTAPVFIRISYGSGANASGNNVAIRLNVASATNGAGVLTGLIITGSGATSSYFDMQGNISTANPTNTTSPLYVSYNGGHFSFIHGLRNAGNNLYNDSPGYFFITRTINSTTGADSADGLGIIHGYSNAVYKTIDYAGSTVMSSASILTTFQNLNWDNTHNTANELFMYQMYINTGNGLKQLGGVLVCGNSGNINSVPHGSTFSCAIVPGGTSRTYFAYTTNTLPLWSAAITYAGASGPTNIVNEGLYTGTCFVWE